MRMQDILDKGKRNNENVWQKVDKLVILSQPYIYVCICYQCSVADAALLIHFRMSSHQIKRKEGILKPTVTAGEDM